MTRVQIFVVLLLGASLAACGGSDTKPLSCKNSLEYQDRVKGKRVVSPDDLDQLNSLMEMPIPAADPNAPKMPPGVCDDMPPVIKATGT